MFDKHTTELTPNDIYALPAQEIERNPSILLGCYYDHLRGLGIDQYACEWSQCESERMEIRIIKFFDFDGRRFWRLATVWLDNKPIMVIQNAGREGDDHEERFITDPDGFRELGQHLRTILKMREEPLEDVVKPDEVLGRKLIDFYGNSLDSYFERYRY